MDPNIGPILVRYIVYKKKFPKQRSDAPLKQDRKSKTNVFNEDWKTGYEMLLGNVVKTEITPNSNRSTRRDCGTFGGRVVTWMLSV